MFQWDHHYQLNSVFWTLGVEVHIYIITPLLIFGYQAISNKEVKWFGLYLMILIILWLYSKTPLFVNWDIRNIMGGISHFAVGFMLAGYLDKITQSFNQKNMSYSL